MSMKRHLCDIYLCKYSMESVRFELTVPILVSHDFSSALGHKQAFHRFVVIVRCSALIVTILKVIIGPGLIHRWRFR